MSLLQNIRSVRKYIKTYIPDIPLAVYILPNDLDNIVRLWRINMIDTLMELSSMDPEIAMIKLDHIKKIINYIN